MLDATCADGGSSPSALSTVAAPGASGTDNVCDGGQDDDEAEEEEKDEDEEEEVGDCDSREEWEAAEWEEAREEWHSDRPSFCTADTDRLAGQTSDTEAERPAPLRRKRRNPEEEERQVACLPCDLDEDLAAHTGSTRSGHSFGLADMSDGSPEPRATRVDALAFGDAAVAIGAAGRPRGVDSPGHAAQPPTSPGHGAWLAEPVSIDEPLLSLDEEATDDRKDELARLKEELAQARAASKADRAALEEAEASAEANRRECEELRGESRVLRLQLQDHHGIMAADWAQTLGFQERLKQEEVARERLAAEAAELRAAAAARAEEARALRTDAALWQLLTRPEMLGEATSGELDNLLDITVPAMARLQSESQQRSRTARMQLHSELEQQLCVVCRDARKTVLFLPCHHICVCEACHGRLHRKRCPVCQEAVQSYVGRVHF